KLKKLNLPSSRELSWSFPSSQEKSLPPLEEIIRAHLEKTFHLSIDGFSRIYSSDEIILKPMSKNHLPIYLSPHERFPDYSGLLGLSLFSDDLLIWYYLSEMDEKIDNLQSWSGLALIPTPNEERDPFLEGQRRLLVSSLRQEG